MNEQEITGIITEKVIKRSGDSDDKYLIFVRQENNEMIVIENTDSVLNGKFNSSDIYAILHVGKKYVFTTKGYRIRLFSMYQNIIKVREVK